MAQYIEDSDIGVRYKSDHNPISINLEFVEQERGRWNRKFNNSFLGDVECRFDKACMKETVKFWLVGWLF